MNFIWSPRAETAAKKRHHYANCAICMDLDASIDSGSDGGARTFNGQQKVQPEFPWKAPKSCQTRLLKGKIITFFGARALEALEAQRSSARALDRLIKRSRALERSDGKLYGKLSQQSSPTRHWLDSVEPTERIRRPGRYRSVDR